ncbi:MAG: hypothetical protein U1F43_19560 [Myxococcota bacterium]
MRARVAPALGAFDGDGAYHPLPKGVRELEAEALIFGAVRVAPRFQLGLQLPLVLHNRAADGIDAAGGGPGDVALGLRWDPLLAGESGGSPASGSSSPWWRRPAPHPRTRPTISPSTRPGSAPGSSASTPPSSTSSAPRASGS